MFVAVVKAVPNQIIQSNQLLFLVNFLLFNLLQLTTANHVLFPDDPLLNTGSDDTTSIGLNNLHLLIPDLSLKNGNPGEGNSVPEGACITPQGLSGRCNVMNHCPYLLALFDEWHVVPQSREIIRSSVCWFDRQLRKINFCCPDIIPTEEECGIAFAIKVVGGESTTPGQHPWLVAVGNVRPRGTFQARCGGTLITKRHVLTADHCFRLLDLMTHVSVGDYNLNEANDGAPFTVHLKIIDRKIYGYKPKTFENDINMLVLERDVKFNDYIRPACLPFKFKSAEFHDEHLEIVGWGRTGNDSQKETDIPYYGYVNVVPRGVCNQNYKTTITKLAIDNKIICAGNGGTDSCQGDSGGPLTYLDINNSRSYLVGIVAYGVGCGRPEFPGVYTRVSAYLDWIVNNLN